MLRRFFVILLLIMLPLQTVWGSVASYCQHERAAGTQHVGHHSHEHAASQLDDGSGDTGSTDTDCDYCHHAHANMLTAVIRADYTPWRLPPPAAGVDEYWSFIADITHPPDI
jgi:ABC-type nickel/cobalt efflux system permease component RcnA